MTITLALIPFAVIGWLFLAMLVTGLLTNSKYHKRTERFINWAFSDSQHCAKAYVSEMEGVQNAKEYR